MPMNTNRFRLCPPLLRNCALALISAAALPAAAWAQVVDTTPVPTKIVFAQVQGQPPITARLNKFGENYFTGTANNVMGGTNCKGVSYPNEAWPAGCQLTFRGRQINIQYTPEADLKAGVFRQVDLNCDDKQCIPNYRLDPRTGKPLTTTNPEP